MEDSVFNVLQGHKLCIPCSKVELSMEFLNEWWGRNEDITVSEIAARAAVMFVVALVLIRLSGMRPFGKENVYDTIVAFLIGGILSRGVVGATPFFSTIAAAITLILLHKIIVKLSILSKSWERFVKGQTVVLYRNGKFFF
jgi:uncharacterized membrane protein YcaP (DUF421 family)